MKREMGRTLFRADWVEAAFLHYRVRPEILQPDIPFPLDLRQGEAWVSLVAFTMRRLRPAFGGRAAECLFAPLSPCRFLNVRTYVKAHGEPGIYFMAEWISNRWSVPLGPVSFGLPYRLGRLDYRNSLAGGCAGTVVADRRGEPLRYRARPCDGAALGPAEAGSLDEFLLERYSAFTRWASLDRVFRIRHDPWLLQPMRAEVSGGAFLGETGRWFTGAQPDCAHYSSGVEEVRISWPGRISFTSTGV